MFSILKLLVSCGGAAFFVRTGTEKFTEMCDLCAMWIVSEIAGQNCCTLIVCQFPHQVEMKNIVKLFEIFHHFRNTLWIRLNSWSCMNFCKKYFKCISFKLDFHSFILHLSIRNRQKKDTKNVFFCDVVKECLAPKINKLYQKKPKSAFLPWPVATVEICPFQ